MSRTDRDHLRALAICHYVLGGLLFLFGAFPAIYIVIGVVFVTEGFGPPQQQPGVKGQAPPPPPAEVGWVLIAFGSAGVACAWALAAGLVAAGRCMSRRKARTFCLVVAGFACLFQPFGLVLGVFTFIVLLRPSVRDGFEPPRDEPPEFDRYHSE